MTKSIPTQEVEQGLPGEWPETRGQRDRDRSDSMLNLRPKPMLILTSFGAIRRMNYALQELMGVDADDLIGQLWWSLCETEHSHEGVLRLQSMLEHDDVEGYELPLMTAAGEERRIRWDFVRTFDQVGAPDEIIGWGVVIPEPEQGERDGAP